MHINESQQLETEDAFYGRICELLRSNTWIQELTNDASFWRLPDTSLMLSLNRSTDIINFSSRLTSVTFYPLSDGDRKFQFDDSWSHYHFSENPDDSEIENFRRMLVRRSIEALI